MTVTNAIKQHGEVATESIMKEIGQIIDKGCLKPVKYENIPFEHRAQILRTIIFVKVKKDGRIKTRLVVDGRGQRHLEYDMSSRVYAQDPNFGFHFPIFGFQAFFHFSNFGLKPEI